MPPNFRQSVRFSLAQTAYSLLLVFIFPFALARLWIRGLKLPAYRLRWRERFGLFSKEVVKGKPVVWLHTVSVGEFITAKPIINHLLASDAFSIVVTTTTPSASEQVVNTYGDKLTHVYSPFDFKVFVRAFLKKIRPGLVVILETELWPNTILCCHQKKIPVLIVNGRLSKKSANGYRRISWLFRPMMDRVSHVAVQNAQDAKRFYELGLDPKKSTITGSIKFDVSITEVMQEKALALREHFSIGGKRQIIVAASTHKGEDKAVLDAFVEVQKSFPHCLLLLAPRHPDRFNAVYELCHSRKFRLARRSNFSSPQLEDHILLCDTMGELLLMYGSADVAFVGGTLVNNGGHNFIEAAVWGVPVLSGPSTFNFAQVSSLLLNAGGMEIVGNEHELAASVIRLLSDPDERAKRGQAALAVTKRNRGATEKTNALIARWLPRSEWSVQ